MDPEEIALSKPCTVSNILRPGKRSSKHGTVKATLDGAAVVVVVNGAATEDAGAPPPAKPKPPPVEGAGAAAPKNPVGAAADDVPPVAGDAPNAVLVAGVGALGAAPPKLKPAAGVEGFVLLVALAVFDPAGAAAAGVPPVKLNTIEMESF